MSRNYDEEFVTRLFTEMSPSYDVVNLVSSFGFSEFWRAKCAGNLELRTGDVVVDFRAGRGECRSYVRRRIKATGRIFSVDICPAMCKRKEARLSHHAQKPIDIRCENALSTRLPASSLDHVISAFGLKTFNATQLRRLIAEIFCILRPGGSCSLLEISTPRVCFLRSAYLFYIGIVISRVGRIFLKNIQCYRMLGVYTEAFGDCGQVADYLGKAGFRVTLKRHFFGCASSVVATKPEKSVA